MNQHQENREKVRGLIKEFLQIKLQTMKRNRYKSTLLRSFNVSHKPHSGYILITLKYTIDLRYLTDDIDIYDILTFAFDIPPLETFGFFSYLPSYDWYVMQEINSSPIHEHRLNGDFSISCRHVYKQWLHQHQINKLDNISIHECKKCSVVIEVLKVREKMPPGPLRVKVVSSNTVESRFLDTIALLERMSLPQPDSDTLAKLIEHAYTSTHIHTYTQDARMKRFKRIPKNTYRQAHERTSTHMHTYRKPRKHTHKHTQKYNY